MSRCQVRSLLGTRGSTLSIRISYVLAALLAVLSGPVQAQTAAGKASDGALSCNPRIELAAQGSPFFLNDKIHIQADIGAATIQGGSNILIDEFKYALDCAIGQTIRNCIAEGNLVSLDDLNITTNCQDTSEAPVTWQVTEANIRTFTPTSGRPVIVPANSTCRVEFDVSVHELNGEDNLVRQSLGWTAGDARCDNGLTASANSAINISIQECGIDLVKEVSVDGGGSWHDANSPNLDALLEVGGDAMYRLSVENTGTVGYVQPINIVDSDLNINTTIPALGAGESTVVNGNSIPGLNVENRCANIGFVENVASAEAFCRVGQDPVGATDEDPAWVYCIPPGGLSIRKEISIDAGETWHDANSTQTAPVTRFPSGAEYRLTVTNTGAAALQDVVVNDGALNIVDFPVGNLDLDASIQLTSAEIPALGVNERCATAGTFNNVATADGASAVTGNPVPQASDPANLVCIAAPEVSIVKEISVDGGTTWHDANNAGTAPVVDHPSGAEYRLTLSNTGSVDLTDVVVNDAILGVNNYLVGDLGIGASVVLDSGTIGALSVSPRCNAAGTFTNTATADGESAEDGTPAPQASDPAVLVCVEPPTIAVLKEISVDGGTTWEDANSEVTAPIVMFPSGAEYRITVTNPGPTGLVDVVVNDAELNIVDYPVGDLDAGASVVLDSGDIPALGVTTACDSADTVTNTATADGDSAQTGSAAPQASDPAVLVCIGSSSIALVKEISVDGGANWHDANDLNTAAIAVFPSPALYRLTVTNNGTSPLTSVVVDDPSLGVDDYAVGDLAVGEIVILTEVEIPQLSFSERCGERGTFVNTATATGTSTEDLSQVNDTDPAYLVCVGEPHLSIVKEISVDGGTTWYDDAPPPQPYPADAWYRLTVTNDGTAPLEDVTVDDPTLAVMDYVIGTLAVGESAVLTENEIPELYYMDRCTSGGTFMNSASAAGTSADYPFEQVNDSDMANLECIGDPMVELDKEISVDGGATYVDADDLNTAAIALAPAHAHYRLIIRNVGSVALTNIVVNDPTLSVADYPVSDLAVGAEVTIDSGDLAALFVEERCVSVGTFVNTASVSAESADGTPTNDSDPAWLSCVGTPDIRIVKEISTNGGLHWFDDSSTAELPPSDALYRLTVTNTGNSDLDNVEVSDLTLGISGHPVGFLETGDSVLLTHEDIPALSTTDRCTSPGEYVNTATASGISVNFPFETVNDSDPATLVCIAFDDVCEPNKPTRLRLQYDADSDSSHSQDSGEVIIDPPDAIFPASVYIEVYGHHNDLIATHANVPPGYVFEVAGQRRRIPPRLEFLIYTAPGGTLLQHVQFHSSCSQPLETGDEFGAITIVAGIN